jgi:hypothetical protein
MVMYRLRRKFMAQSSPENPFASEEVMPPYNELWALRRSINQKLKQLALQVVTKSTSVQALQQLVTQLSDAVQTLAEGDDLLGRERWVAAQEHGSIRVISREIAPLAGQSSVVAPPLHMWFDVEAKKSYGKTTLNWLYEGPPFCAHGGIIAALFDEFLGCTQILSGKTGATGVLTLRYHAPTPLNTELRFEGEVKSVDGRKIMITGDMFANGKRTVSGEGLFITLPEGVMNLSKR